MGLPIVGQVGINVTLTSPDLTFRRNTISYLWHSTSAGIIPTFWLLWGLLLVSPGFLVFEFPTLYISQKFRLAKYLGITKTLVLWLIVTDKIPGVNIVIWGALLMLHAATTSFGAFFALRFLLGRLRHLFLLRGFTIFHVNSGMCESCVAPILILIISMFYKKNEQASERYRSSGSRYLLNIHNRRLE